MPSKRSKPPKAYLFHIRENVTLARSFVEGFDYESFRDNQLVFYAVMRALEIISEASRRLPDELKARHPSISWKNMAGAGNVYCPDYEDVADVFRLGRFGGSSSTAAPCRGTGTRGFG